MRELVLELDGKGRGNAPGGGGGAVQVALKVTVRVRQSRPPTELPRTAHRPLRMEIDTPDGRVPSRFLLLLSEAHYSSWTLVDSKHAHTMRRIEVRGQVSFRRRRRGLDSGRELQQRIVHENQRHDPSCDALLLQVVPQRMF